MMSCLRQAHAQFSIEQLFARRGALPSGANASDNKEWTSFVMPLRETAPFPGRPVDIARFLATSLTFMANIRDVSMYFDQHRLVHLTKSVGRTKNIPLFASLDPRSKPMGIMTVKYIGSTGQSKNPKRGWDTQTGGVRRSSDTSRRFAVGV